MSLIKTSNHHFKPNAIPKSTLCVGPGLYAFNRHLALKKLPYISRTGYYQWIAGGPLRPSSRRRSQKRAEFVAAYLQLEQAALIRQRSARMVQVDGRPIAISEVPARNQKDGQNN